MTAMTDHPQRYRPPIEIEQRDRLCHAIRPEDTELAAGDEHEIAGSHAERSPILERDARRTPAEIVEHRIWKPRQRHTPGAPVLVVEQQGPTQANAIEHVGENVHARRLRPRTIGCKIRMIALYRPRHGGTSFQSQASAERRGSSGLTPLWSCQATPLAAKALTLKLAPQTGERLSRL
jgi:hypothetical protein